MEKKIYKVTVKYSESNYGGFIALAESTNDITSKSEIIAIEEGTQADIEEAERKGKSIVEFEHVEVLQIKDLLAEVMENADEETEDYYAELENYNDGYICDIISQIADNNTSIYYSDIMDFIRENPESLAEVVDEGLYEVGRGQEYDLFKHGQSAEYMTIENAIYKDIDNMLLWYSLKYFAQYSETITQEQYDDLESNAKYNRIDTLDEITDSIDLIFAEETEA